MSAQKKNNPHTSLQTLLISEFPFSVISEQAARCIHMALPDGEVTDRAQSSMAFNKEALLKMHIWHLNPEPPHPSLGLWLPGLVVISGVILVVHTLCKSQPKPLGGWVQALEKQIGVSQRGPLGWLWGSVGTCADLPPLMPRFPLSHEMGFLPVANSVTSPMLIKC